MAAPESMPLILFSGLAADANVFVPQKVTFPQLVVPAWPKPQPYDTLDSYCERLSESIRPEPGTIIGGASFGGIIALHVAQYCQPAAVILIGSIRSPAERPRWIRFFRPLKALIALMPVRLLQICCAPIASQLARRWCPHHCGLARQFRDPNINLDTVVRENANDYARQGTTLATKPYRADDEILFIRHEVGPHVRHMAAKISNGSEHEAGMANCSACFVVCFADLEKVLDEVNTLIDVQSTLQDLTGGYLYLEWNESLTAPE